jgi:methanogenic corrinoid protein MtbC1
MSASPAKARRQPGAAQGPAARDILSRLIERDVIPRLIQSERVGPWPSPQPSAATPDAVPADVELVRLVLQHDASVAAEYVQSLRVQGASVETLCLEVLTDAARRLGEMWQQDVCDFVDVTVGVGRLQHVLHILGPGLQVAAEVRENGPRVLLVPMPGEQHRFGLSMVLEFFRRAGWRAATAEVVSNSDLVALVRRTRFAVVGLSTGCDGRLEPIAAAITAIRGASSQRDVRVMVGGPIFVQQPQLALLVGADATAIDGREAVEKAGKLLDGSARRS